MVLKRHAQRLIAKLRSTGARHPSRILQHYRRRHAINSVRLIYPEIAGDQQTLLEFGDQSGTEFSALAESLTKLDTGLTEVGTQATKLNAILQDQDEDRALFSAFELYKKSVDLAHASIGIALSQEDQMAQMEGTLLQNRAPFSRNGLMFRVLVMNIRAEAARVDPENRAIFNSVAGDIDAMQQQMNKTVEAAFSELEIIVNEAAAGRNELHQLQADLHQRAQRSITLLRSELDNIKSSLAPCARASTRILDLLAQTRIQTGDLITSLQYQDIVRQQLEHVCQGFDDLSDHLKSGASQKEIDLGYVHRASRIQQTHLGSSRNAIEKAAGQITTSSDQLLKTGASLVRVFSEMERAAAAVFQESRISDLFKQETDNLVKVASVSEDTNVRIARLLERIENSVRVFSSEIGRYEFDVQLIALNGQIAAARVPNAGALNKLAEETSHLSTATAALTREMSTQLRDTLKKLQSIRTEADEVRQTIGREKVDLANGSVIVGDKIARLHDRIQHSSTQLARSFGTAYNRVRDLLPTLRFPGLIDPCYAPAEDFCVRLIEITAVFGSVALSQEGASRLTEHQSRYTMQGEREAHAGAVVAGPKNQIAPTVESVELFDDVPCDSASTNVTHSQTFSHDSASSGSHAPVTSPSHSSASASLGDGVELF